MYVYEYVIAYRFPGSDNLGLTDEKSHLMVANSKLDVVKRVIHELDLHEVRRIASSRPDRRLEIEDVKILVRRFGDETS